jgi:hypothetical protein
VAGSGRLEAAVAVGGQGGGGFHSGVAAGFVVGQGDTNFLPWQPEKDRPVLRFVARLAKFGLWIMVVQPPPPDNTYVARCEEGEICVNHREGW